jgi:hypothetical protein
VTASRWIGGVAVAAALAACGSSPGAPRPTFVQGTPTVQVRQLVVTLSGEPERSFGFGKWHVCDKGTVTNPSSLTAHGVRVSATYYDHGSVEGTATPSPIGDIGPQQAQQFTICGYARNEPDRDVVSAAPSS